MRKLIGITGAHGTGKTHAALVRAAALKTEHPDKRIGIVTEVAGECPFPINKRGNEDAQLWMFAEQLRRELEAMRHYDLIVCDRTPADSIAYTWVLGYDALALAMTKTAAAHMARHYQQIIFRTCDKNRYCLADGIRDTDLAFREAVESELQSTYRRLMLLERIQYV